MIPCELYARFDVEPIRRIEDLSALERKYLYIAETRENTVYAPILAF